MLAAVAQRVAAAAEPVCAAYLNRACGFVVRLDPSDSARASAHGTRDVTLTAGMVRLVETEDELAAVVAHEFGHHLAGHLGRQRTRGAVAGTVAATALGAVVPFGGLAGWALGQGAAQLGAGAARLAYSKGEEREADYLGAYLVARAGYDLERAGNLWARLSRPDAAARGSGLGGAPRHPSGGGRAARGVAPGGGGDPRLARPDAAAPGGIAVEPRARAVRPDGRTCWQPRIAAQVGPPRRNMNVAPAARRVLPGAACSTQHGPHGGPRADGEREGRCRGGGRGRSACAAGVERRRKPGPRRPVNKPMVQPLGGLDASGDAPPGLAEAPPPPFLEFARGVQRQSALRARITDAYRRPEEECLPPLLAAATLPEPVARAARGLARRLVEALRAKGGRGGVEALMREFSLSSEEGVALMCLAEALLRIPDSETRDALIRDKVGARDWRSHLGHSPSLFVNAATWGLVVTGKLTATSSEAGLAAALTRLIGRGGEPVIRKGVDLAMRMLGEQFVCGQTIEEALANSRRMEAKGFRYSYDMLGEAAATAADAARYFRDYEGAIHAIGKAAGGRGVVDGPGISVKLSALHPRYARAQRERVMGELLPRVLALAALARRLRHRPQHRRRGSGPARPVARHPGGALLRAGAGGMGRHRLRGAGLRQARLCHRGLAGGPRAAQRPPPDGAAGEGRLLGQRDQARAGGRAGGLPGLHPQGPHGRLLPRLRAQAAGRAGRGCFPQFATHNAQTLAAIHAMAGEDFRPGRYEFQCLHGMGEPLYEEVVGPAKLDRPCRIYAPVGTHETLLAYLVRRLLENGANSSFVNRIGDATGAGRGVDRRPGGGGARHRARRRARIRASPCRGRCSGRSGRTAPGSTCRTSSASPRSPPCCWRAPARRCAPRRCSATARRPAKRARCATPPTAATWWAASSRRRRRRWTRPSPRPPPPRLSGARSPPAERAACLHARSGR